jgi:hypothetical protein
MSGVLVEPPFRAERSRRATGRRRSPGPDWFFGQVQLNLKSICSTKPCNWLEIRVEWSWQPLCRLAVQGALFGETIGDNNEIE